MQTFDKILTFQCFSGRALRRLLTALNSDVPCGSIRHLIGDTLYGKEKKQQQTQNEVRFQFYLNNFYNKIKLWKKF